MARLARYFFHIIRRWAGSDGKNWYTCLLVRWSSCCPDHEELLLMVRGQEEVESLSRGAIWRSIALETPDIQPVALDDKIYLRLLWSIRRLLQDIGIIGNGKFGTFGWLMDRKDNVCSYMFRLSGRNKDCNCFWSGYHIHEDQNALDGYTSVLTRKSFLKCYM